MEIIIKKQESKKTGKEYTAAYIDLGYKRVYVAVGTLECAELARLLPQELEREIAGGREYKI